MHFDTIVAPITGPGPAAVAIVRLSGADAWSIAGRVFSPFPKQPESHRAYYGVVANGDDCLALLFSEGHSYTGDASVELSVHGSPASVRSLVDACRLEGARLAEPGEFTQRAFLNGRIDLTQAEGVRDTIEAETSAQLRQAHLVREGFLKKDIDRIREQLLSVLTAVEASVDFSEEIGEYDRGEGLASLSILLDAVQALLSTAARGRILRRGLRIALVGAPNAGKSSLLNALLNAERSIVTELPGTTRDYIEEQVELAGVKCVLIDTAGLRESDDRAESIGIQKSRTVAFQADELWYLYDSAQGWTPEDDLNLASFDRPVLVIANKADLASPERGIAVSALRSEGLDILESHVWHLVKDAATHPCVQDRHELPLREAINALEGCLSALRQHLPDDLLSVGLREAIRKLGEITGETASPDIIERIFHDFCIGK